MIDTGSAQVYLALGVTDMRKSINGLSLLVENGDLGDLFSGSLFVFCNRNQTIVKILYWHVNGFCLWQKRLEKDRFKWPKDAREVILIKPAQLTWLLSGLDIHQAHESLTYTRVN